MRKHIVALTLLLSLSVEADLEHHSGQGTPPSKKNLNLARGCFQELEQRGCGHPREDQQYFIGCLHNNEDQLSKSCQNFFGILYGNQSAQAK